ncbi:MAG: hypothetical protein QM622_02735 [Microbacterium sp.]
MRWFSIPVAVVALVAMSGCAVDTAPVPEATATTATRASLECLPPAADEYASELEAMATIDLDPDTLLGLTVEDASARISEAGGEVRVIAEDGTCHDLTADYQADRVDLAIDGGTISWAGIG